MNKILKNQFFHKLVGFSFVGCIVTLFSMVLLYLFNDLCHINAYVAYASAYILSVLLSYSMNTQVYNTKPSIKTIVLYFLSYLSSMGVGIGVLCMFVFIFPDWNRTILSYMVIPITTLYNFILVSLILQKKEVKK